MKKWRIVAVIVLCLMAATVTFNKSVMPVYAYTQEEKEAAKAWLAAHGYPPTRAGAEQAYQDYLDGKIPHPGEEGKTEEPEVPENTMPEMTPTETVSVEETTPEVTGQNQGVTQTAGEKESTVEEIETEEITSQEIEDETSVSIAQMEGMADINESVSKEDSSMEMTTNETEEPESLSETSAEGDFVHVGRFDGIIVVIAVATCAAMIFFTVRYIKKERKDGE